MYRKAEMMEQLLHTKYALKKKFFIIENETKDTFKLRSY
jgi:hypothetical protein